MAKKFVVSLVALAFALALLVALRGGGPFREAAAQASPAKEASKAVPVQAAVVRRTDVDVVLSGLGSVVPSKTVTVRSRVAGQLVRIAFREGELVEKGQLLAELDARSFQARVEQAEGQLVRDRALLDNARIELERANALAKDALVSGQQVAAQYSLHEQYRGAERIGQGVLAAAKLDLDFTRITAPIRGRVGFRLVDVGNNLTTSDDLLLIHAVEPVAVVFSLTEDKVQTVVQRLRESEQRGQALPVEAWNKGSRALLERGTLLTIDNQIDVTTGTVRLKAEFANAGGVLFPNQFVNVRFVVDTLHEALVVPSAAVQRGRDGSFVYLIDAQDRIQIRNVGLGETEAGSVVVREGLTEGERVVLAGADQIREGVHVKVLPTPTGDKRGGLAAAARPER